MYESRKRRRPSGVGEGRNPRSRTSEDLQLRERCARVEANAQTPEDIRAIALYAEAQGYPYADLTLETDPKGLCRALGLSPPFEFEEQPVELQLKQLEDAVWSDPLSAIHLCETSKGLLSLCTHANTTVILPSGRAVRVPLIKAAVMLQSTRGRRLWDAMELCILRSLPSCARSPLPRPGDLDELRRWAYLTPEIFEIEGGHGGGGGGGWNGGSNDDEDEDEDEDEDDNGRNDSGSLPDIFPRGSQQFVTVQMVRTGGPDDAWGLRSGVYTYPKIQEKLHCVAVITVDDLNYMLRQSLAGWRGTPEEGEEGEEEGGDREKEEAEEEEEEGEEEEKEPPVKGRHESAATFLAHEAGALATDEAADILKTNLIYGPARRVMRERGLCRSIPDEVPLGDVVEAVIYLIAPLGARLGAPPAAPLGNPPGIPTGQRWQRGVGGAYHDDDGDDERKIIVAAEYRSAETARLPQSQSYFGVKCPGRYLLIVASEGGPPRALGLSRTTGPVWALLQYRGHLDEGEFGFRAVVRELYPRELSDEPSGGTLTWDIPSGRTPVAEDAADVFLWEIVTAVRQGGLGDAVALVFRALSPAEVKELDHEELNRYVKDDPLARQPLVAATLAKMGPDTKLRAVDIDGCDLGALFAKIMGLGRSVQQE